MQCTGLTLLGIGMLADVDTAGGASDAARLHSGANFTGAHSTLKELVGGGDVTERANNLKGTHTERMLDPHLNRGTVGKSGYKRMPRLVGEDSSAAGNAGQNRDAPHPGPCLNGASPIYRFYVRMRAREWHCAPGTKRASVGAGKYH